MRGLLPMALLLLLLPTAAGQSLGVDFTLTGVEVEDEGRLTANVDASTLVVSWTVACKGIASQPHGLLIPSAIIQYEPPVAAAGLSVSGALSTAVEMPDCVTKDSVAGTSNFTVAASQEALGEAPLPIRFEATLKSPQTDTAEDAPAEPIQANVTVGYIGLLTVHAPATIQEGRLGETLSYQVVVSNLGNTDTLVELTVAQAPPNGVLELPKPVLLPRNGTMSLTVQHTPDEASTETFAIHLTPRSARDPLVAGNVVQVNMLARALPDPRLGTDQDVAAAPAPAAALALAVLALVAARRRA